jgi:hypothetical protein
MASYEWLTKQFGENNVYIASSNVQDPQTSPFEYADKVKMAAKLGVPPGHIVNVKNPYQATEITSSLSDEEKANTALVFAVSEKDAERFNFKPKKDGSLGYLQPVPDNKKGMKPMTKHGYVAITPTVNFQVRGADANSASEIRKLYRNGNDNDRLQIITDLYGMPDPELKAVFDKQLGVNDPQEAIIYGQDAVFAGDNPVNVMSEDRYQRLQENIRFMRKKIRALRDGQDYIDEHRPRKK